MTYIEEVRSLVGQRPLILVGALVMIFDENDRVLLQHRTDDQTWAFPGGFMELGETTEETAIREVKEETGLEIGELSLFKVFSGKQYFYKCPNGDQVAPVSLVYVTQDAHGDLIPDGHEGSEVGFFPANDLPNGTIPPVRRLIESFLETRKIYNNAKGA